MSVVQFLEARSFNVGAGALVDGEVEFKELIRPVGAGTGIRNCRTFKGFLRFSGIHPFLNNQSLFSTSIIRVEETFVQSTVGKFTPRRAWAA